MSITAYILQGHEPVRCPDLATWGRWLETATTKRIVCQTTVGRYLVSTVFLGMDHNFGSSGPPLLFETMIFFNPATARLQDESVEGWWERSGGIEDDPEHLDDWQERYSTWDEAAAGHERAVKMVEERTGAARTA